MVLHMAEESDQCEAQAGYKGMEVKVLGLGSRGTRLYHFHNSTLVLSQALALGQSTAEVRETGSEMHGTESPRAARSWVLCLEALTRAHLDHRALSSPASPFSTWNAQQPPVSQHQPSHGPPSSLGVLLWQLYLPALRVAQNQAGSPWQVCIMLSVWGKFRS